jgi:hypothetical protein
MKKISKNHNRGGHRYEAVFLSYNENRAWWRVTARDPGLVMSL